MDFGFLKKKTSAVVAHCGIYFSQDRVTLCQVNRAAEKQAPTLSFIAQHEYTSKSLSSILRQLVKEHSLKNIPCCWILSPSDYQLFILDKPAIPETEIAAALRWQVKDLITYPAHEAVTQFVTIPSHHAATAKIFVAVARLSALEEREQLLREAGLHLTSIDILELSLRNLCSVVDQKAYTGLLLLGSAQTEFVITHVSQLLLSLRDNNTCENIAQLVPEITRAFTFCQHQLQESFPNTLYVSGGTPQQLVYLSATVEEIQVLPYAVTLCCQGKELEKNYLSISSDAWIALGGALRQEV